MKTKLPRSFLEATWIFVAISVIFGTVYAVVTPPLWGLDETNHFGRVYQLAHGELLPDTGSKATYGGYLPGSLVYLEKYVAVDLVDNQVGPTSPRITDILSRHDVNRASDYTSLAAQSFSKDMVQSPRTSSYSPVAYVGALVGTVIADSFHASIGRTILSARLMSLLLYVGIVGLALWLLRKSRLKWLIFSVALLPQSLYLASVITADNMVIGLSLLFMAIFLRLVLGGTDQRTHALLYALAIVGVLLPLVKINYLFLSLGFVLLPTHLFHSFKESLVLKIGGMSLMTILPLMWAAVSKPTNESPTSQRPDHVKIIPVDQIQFILHHPLDFVAAMTRTTIQSADSFAESLTSLIGWNYVSIPIFFMVVLWIGIFLAATNARPELVHLRKRLVVLSILIILGMVSIFGVLYVSFTPTGSRTVDGVQGRYFIPFVVPLVMFFASFMPLDVKIEDKIAPHVFGVVTAACLAVSAIYYVSATY